MRHCERFKWWSIKGLITRISLKAVKGQFAKIPQSVQNYIGFSLWRNTRLFQNSMMVLKQSDREAIVRLLKSRCNFDVEDTSGMTAVMRAAMNGNFEEAKILHLAHVLLLNDRANITRASCSYQEWRNLEIPVISELIWKLRQKGASSEQIGQVIARVSELFICDVVVFDDLAMTKSFLQSLPDDSGEFGIVSAFETLVPMLDLEHVKVILQYSRNCDWALREFVVYITQTIRIYHKAQTGRDLLKRIFSWEIFDEKHKFKHIEFALRRATKQSVKIFLKYGFHTSVKAKYNIDLLACLFGSFRDSSVCCLLSNDQIDVHGRGFDGDTPLHFAVSEMFIDNVRVLLDKGADPNALDLWHKVPISNILNNNDTETDYGITRMLLLAGANPFLIKNQIDILRSGYAYNPQWFANSYMKIIKLLVAQAVVHEALGHIIEDPIRSYMNLLAVELNDFYSECRAQLNCLKACKIRENCRSELSAFTILAENPSLTVRYIQKSDLQVISMLVKINKDKLHSYYRDLLQKHVREIVRIYRYRVRALQVMCQLTGINDSHHLVINKIVDYLTIEDMQILSMLPVE